MRQNLLGDIIAHQILILRRYTKESDSVLIIAISGLGINFGELLL